VQASPARRAHRRATADARTTRCRACEHTAWARPCGALAVAACHASQRQPASRRRIPGPGSGRHTTQYINQTNPRTYRAHEPAEHVECSLAVLRPVAARHAAQPGQQRWPLPRRHCQARGRGDRRRRVAPHRRGWLGSDRRQQARLYVLSRLARHRLMSGYGACHGACLRECGAAGTQGGGSTSAACLVRV